MPNDNLNWPKGGTGLRGNADATPNVPEYGEPQPLRDTANNASHPGVVFPTKRGTHAHDSATPDFLPTGGTVSEDNTDVIDLEAKA